METPNFERIRPYDEDRMMFRLFAQLLKELKQLPMPVHTTQKVRRMQHETEDFLTKMSQEKGEEFNMERFRHVSNPKNPEEVT
ncbi:MAG: hypothetical protein V3S55_07730 [Nitrospiraceae bacterium]